VCDPPTPISQFYLPRSLGSTTWRYDALDWICQVGEGGQAQVWQASIAGSEGFCVKIPKVTPGSCYKGCRARP